jgi:hypothetical protein
MSALEVEIWVQHVSTEERRGEREREGLHPSNIEIPAPGFLTFAGHLVSLSIDKLSFLHTFACYPHFSDRPSPRNVTKLYGSWEDQQSIFLASMGSTWLNHLETCEINIYCIYTLWLFNIAMENDPFIDDVPI